MTAAALLSDLQSRGIQVVADGGTLRVRGRGAQLTPTDRAALTAAKPELLAILTASVQLAGPAPAPAAAVPDLSDLFTDRPRPLTRQELAAIARFAARSAGFEPTESYVRSVARRAELFADADPRHSLGD